MVHSAEDEGLLSISIFPTLRKKEKCFVLFSMYLVEMFCGVEENIDFYISKYFYNENSLKLELKEVKNSKTKIKRLL